MSYVPLHVHSNFSFLEGASHPEELVTSAHLLGLPALALTDRDGLYGAVRAHARARELGVRLLIGSQVSLEDDSSLILLACDRDGYGRLCQLLSRGRLRAAKGSARLHWAEILEDGRGLLALAPMQPGGLLGRPSLSGPSASPEARLRALQSVFGDRLYLLLYRHREPADEEHIAVALRLADELAIPTVAAAQVLYHQADRQALHDVLTCVRHGCTLAEAGRRLRPNAAHALPLPEEFGALWADHPEAVARGLEIAARCHFSLDELRYRYPSEDLPGGGSTRERLRGLVLAGAEARYPAAAPPPEVHRQIERELAVIAQLDYEGYFLTMYEIVRFCRSQGILCQGRGSAANSTVCYCLGITAIDPVRMDLLFERFLSLERAEPPDIDLDIQSDRREEVIQWVYERYGRRHAAMVATVIRYRGRSAVRDVGKALGLAPGQLDAIAGLLSHWSSGLDPATVRQAGFDPDSPLLARLIERIGEIQHFPRHLAIHPGGFMLGQVPVDTIVPIENATMEGRTVIQWDKDDLETLGIFKVDLLGLGMLGQIDRCLRLLRETRGVELTLATIPPEDPATYAMCRQGDTIGVFQIESRAQMSMLPRLKPRTFYDLVVQVAIIRPGPITGGMVHPYLNRRNGREAVDYPHPSLRPVLEKTLGVPLFQEQVMRLAVVAAGYTPGEADQLRRDMAAWRVKGRIDQHRKKLVEGMRARGISEHFAERVFAQIKGFGEYGFPESHAASFALIAYASAYLKRHYPGEFTCALLNAQPMGFYSPSTILQDARRHGLRIEGVDVNRSDWDCIMEDGHVRLGLRYVKGLGAQHAERFRQARESGPFESVADFARRTGLPRAALESLAGAGAFDSLAQGRREALWDSRLPAPRGQPGARDSYLALESPEPSPGLAGLDAATEILWDYRGMDLSAQGHPMQVLREALRRQDLPTAAELNALPHGSRARYMGMVICRQRPMTAKGVSFLSVEDETGIVNVVLWPQTFDRFPLLAKNAGFLGVDGHVESREGVVHLVAKKLWSPELGDRLPAPRSRDFQ